MVGGELPLSAAGDRKILARLDEVGLQLHRHTKFAFLTTEVAVF